MCNTETSNLQFHVQVAYESEFLHWNKNMAYFQGLSPHISYSICNILWFFLGFWSPYGMSWNENKLDSFLLWCYTYNHKVHISQFSGHLLLLYSKILANEFSNLLPATICSRRIDRNRSIESIIYILLYPYHCNQKF